MNDMTTEYVAAFDAGTTALKGALVNGQGCIVASASSELDLIINGDYREQSPDQWWQAFCSASRHMIEQARQSESEFNVTRIRGIIFSGQMQDVIALNGELNPVRNAILYSDGRAEEQAKQLAETYQGGAERFLNTVGNRLEGCLPLPKLMWLREHEPETYACIGDAGATTLASGVSHPGQYNINIGTSGWIATVSPEPFTDKPGAANLAFGVEEGFVNAVPFLNAGDVHKWVTGVFADGDYVEAHRLIETSKPGSNGVLCLPYLVGERFPVMNPNIRGAYVGLDPDTTKADMMRAALEGVAFSIRQGMESFDAKPTEISLIGGGARENAWCQILADVLEHPIEVFANADILPAVAMASLVFNVPDLLQSVCECTVYQPNPDTARTYADAYRRFLSLYPMLRTMD